MILKLVRWLAIAILAPIGLFLASAAILGRTPVNAAWTEPAAGVTIYVITNGVHSGLVLPVNSNGVDWRVRTPASDLRDPAATGDWRAFGWGDREFYLNTPDWAHLKIMTALSALTGSGSTLIHVDHWRAFAPDGTVRPLRLRPEEYRRLTAFVAASFAYRPTPIPGFGGNDVFYPAKGHYSAFVTCNVWVGRALAAAGVRTGRWTVFESDVMRWVPLPPDAAMAQPAPHRAGSPARASVLA